LITGYNTDVEFEGRIYHIQTEDKGVNNPVIESFIYLGGEIVDSKRSSYQDLLPGGPDAKLLTARLEEQHRRMVLNVRQGRHDPAGMKAFGAGVISDRGFEEVVREYLSKEMASETLQVTLENPSRFDPGGRHDFLVAARGELTALPVKGVEVTFSLLTPVEKPLLLAQGRTDAQGLYHGSLDIPPVESGGAAVILRANLENEKVELKWMVGAGHEEHR
jgi:hypothetical protein